MMDSRPEDKTLRLIFSVESEFQDRSKEIQHPELTGSSGPFKGLYKEFDKEIFGFYKFWFL